MEIYRVNSRIQSECREIRTKQTQNTDTFHSWDVRTLLEYFVTIVL